MPFGFKCDLSLILFFSVELSELTQFEANLTCNHNECDQIPAGHLLLDSFFVYLLLSWISSPELIREF